MKDKPYKAKSITGAQAEVRLQWEVRRALERLIERQREEIKGLQRDRRLLAKLAAKGPCFDSPLVAMSVATLRDQILREECRLTPGRTPIA